MSVNEVIAHALNNANVSPAGFPALQTSAEIELRFSSEHDLWFHSEGNTRQVREWPVRLRVSFKSTPHAVANQGHLVYHQESIEGVVAWVAGSNFVIDGTPFETRVVFKQNPDGYLVLSGATVTTTLPHNGAG